MSNSNTVCVIMKGMFARTYLLNFSIFSRGASRCSHVAQLAHGLVGRDHINRVLLSVKSWIVFIFRKFYWLIVVCKVIFSMTI